MKVKVEFSASCYKKELPKLAIFLYVKCYILQNIYMYFNYHAKVKRLIESGRATGYIFCKEYKKISPCLLIFFDDERPMPIRQHKFEEYMFLLAKFGVKEKRSSSSVFRKD